MLGDFRSLPAFLALALGAGSALAGPKATSVAIVDSALDTKHPEIRSRLHPIYFETRVRARDGSRTSLSALNRLLRQRYSKTLNDLEPETRERLRAYLDLSSIDADPECHKTLSEGESRRYEASQKRFAQAGERAAVREQRAAYQALIGSLHATHVASLLTEGLSPDTKLLQVPYMPEVLSPEEEHPERYATSLARLFEDLEATIGAAKTRVVNVSAGLIVHPLREGRDPFRLGSLPGLGWSSLFPLVTQFQRVYTEALQNEAFLRRTILLGIGSIARQHPETAFVFSAGNSRADTEDRQPDLVNLDQANVMSVAALARDGGIASFSNFSSAHVDIATLGTCVPGAEAGGGRMRMSGTSQAAPRVANRLAQIFEQIPDLDGATAIRRLLDEQALRDPLLEGSVREGFILP